LDFALLIIPSSGCLNPVPASDIREREQQRQLSGAWLRKSEPAGTATGLVVLLVYLFGF
jgi:hypothetical protein